MAETYLSRESKYWLNVMTSRETRQISVKSEIMITRQTMPKQNSPQFGKKPIP